MTRTTKEYVLVGITLFIILSLVGRAVIIGKSMVRDDLRRQDMTNLKGALERYYNAHTIYVSPPDQTTKPLCTTSGDDSWFFGKKSPLLTEQFIDAIPHDVREGEKSTYQYCATHRNAQGKTVGYVLQAIQEQPAKTGVFFDEDEKRKFSYQISNENNQFFYRVCGGEETLCDIPKK